MFKFSNNSIKRMEGVNPELVLLFQEALKYSPIDFGVPPDGGLRTAERQKELYDASKTKCDGYLNKSPHQLGKALDFYAYINHEASWRREHLAMIAGHILATASRLREEGKIKIGARWGGEFGSVDYTGWDYPHFECYDLD